MAELTDVLTNPKAMSLIGSLLAIAYAVVKAWPWVRRAVHLVDDLYGSDARPGVAARPGLAERLAVLEHDVADTKQAAQAAAYHSAPNSGHSAYDALIDKVDHIAEIFGDHVEDSKTWVRSVNTALGDHGIETPPWPTAKD